jgi:hypothetical protein
MKRLLYCLACVFHTLILNQIGESINTCWYSVLDFSFALYVLYLHIVPELEHELIENFSIVFCLMVDHKSFSWVTFCSVTCRRSILALHFQVNFHVLELWISCSAPD